MWTLGERRFSRHLSSLLGKRGLASGQSGIFCDGGEAAGFLNDGELQWGKEGLPFIYIKYSCKVIETRWKMGKNERH